MKKDKVATPAFAYAEDGLRFVRNGPARGQGRRYFDSTATVSHMVTISTSRDGMSYSGLARSRKEGALPHPTLLCALIRRLAATGVFSTAAASSSPHQQGQSATVHARHVPN